MRRTDALLIQERLLRHLVLSFGLYWRIDASWEGHTHLFCRRVEILMWHRIPISLDGCRILVLHGRMAAHSHVSDVPTI